MKKFIIITSIFEPTKAVKEFAKLKDFQVVVVGDKKSPKNYECDNVVFLSAENSYGFSLEKVLPYNHYCRKMIGYLYAMKQGADIIVETDDDNIPLENFGFPAFQGEFNYINENSGFVNIYSYFTKQKIWPRGLPLNYILKQSPKIQAKQDFKIGVWQGLADGDPDVDAIYRLTDNTPCYFDKNQNPIVLKNGTVCPFNTQNTAFIKDLFPLLYLPATVTFRFTDILKGLVAQPLMWNYGYNLGFTTATVVQERNEHDYMKDFVSEIPCYLDSEKVVNIVQNSIDETKKITENLKNAYNALFRWGGVLEKNELEILDAWIKDCERILK